MLMYTEENFYSFGFGGYPTGRPYNLYSDMGYGQNNRIHYIGGSIEYLGGPNLEELNNQWYVQTFGPM